MEAFRVGPTAASLGLALYVLGYGVGPLLWSPMSEIVRCTACSTLPMGQD